jgi:type IV pilus assembly protein PilE
MIRIKGFTLMELMVAIAIVAIIAAIAYPAYTSYMMSARRGTAKTALLDIAGKEVKYYSTNNTFTATLTDVGFSTATAIPVPDSSTTYYKITVTKNGSGTIADGFLATATPSGVQSSDACGSFSVDEAGNKTYTPNGTDPGSGSCW